MSNYTFYIHTVYGGIAPLSEWRSDYESMDVESWHGKPADECDPADWIEDGKLKAIDLESDDDCFPTDRVFPGWFGDAQQGEEYWAEWACNAVDADNQEYRITWQFTVTKGDEPEDDELPWDDESFIHRIETI